MKPAVVAVLFLVACSDDDSGSGPHFRDAAVDVPRPACGPTAVCPEGPQCGTACCASGEHCENGTCMCGPNPACMPGDSCVSGGPVAPLPDHHYCGAFCCGESTGGCPI